jgi:hypothetical protein
VEDGNYWKRFVESGFNPDFDMPPAVRRTLPNTEIPRVRRVSVRQRRLFGGR